MSATAIEVASEQTDSALIAELLIRVNELQESHNNILTLVQEIKDQVGPLIESLSNSPILKMMGVK